MRSELRVTPHYFTGFLVFRYETKIVTLFQIHVTRTRDWRPEAYGRIWRERFLVCKFPALLENLYLSSDLVYANWDFLLLQVCFIVNRVSSGASGSGKIWKISAMKSHRVSVHFRFEIVQKAISRFNALRWRHIISINHDIGSTDPDRPL